jgi:hypothetical protein
MNITESGSIAIGAPMSIKRLESELEWLFTNNGNYKLFANTQEGAAAIAAYLRLYGGWQKGISPLQAVTSMDGDELRLVDSYLSGILAGIKIYEHGRVTA